MHIICPHCQNPIEMVQVTPEEILCPSCGSSFRLEGGSTTAEEMATSGLNPLAGLMIGKFEILDTVGAGAFGTVYKARDPQLDRLVAIKVLRAGNLASGQEMDRFLREARSVAQLRHTGIVPVHEVGQGKEGPYLVSDFVHGISLADWLSARKPTAHESPRLLAAVADALQYAHDPGVVHRDVKPSNIMLGEDGTPHLMDFGLAKRDAGEITMTLDGQVLGTPAYMSPEQARGEGHRVDGRSDVYSLGVILYLMLTGELPFRGTTRMLLYQVLHDEPRPPRRLNDRIPRDLETICLKAMAKEPNKRYGSAGALADDLRRFLGGQPIAARPTARGEKLWRWCRRNPVVAALTAAVAVVLVAGTGISAYFAVQADERAADAIREKDRADDNSAEARTNAQRADEKAADALANARKAIDEKNRADDNAAEALANLYVAHMNLAQVAWEKGHVVRVLELLDLYRQKPRPGQRDLRGWEWFYQERLCHADLRTFKGHAGEITSVAFSPDGTRLASASWDLTIKVWDAASGQELHNLKGHTSAVHSVAYSPDGARLASARGNIGKPGEVKVWDAGSGQELSKLKGHTRQVTSVAYSPDGRQLASASMDNTLKVWDAASRQELRTLKGHTIFATSVVYSPDGTRLASASSDRTVKVWDANTGQELRTLHTGGVSMVAYSPDGTRLASTTHELKTVKVWDASSGQELRTLQGHTGPVTSVAYSPDGTRLASASYDKTVKVWDASSGQELRTLQGHTGAVTTVAYSPDGTRLASGSIDQTVKLWDAGSGHELRTFKRRFIGVTTVAYSQDGTQLACGFGDHTVKMWDAGSGQELRTLKGHTGGVSSVAYSPDGARLASSSEEVKVWDAGSGQELHTLKGHKGGVLSVVFSPDGALLASAGYDQTVKVWDAVSGQELHTLKGHKGGVLSVVFSPDGSRVASASWDKTVRIWNASSGHELRTLQNHRGTVNSIAFSRDGTRLASASNDATVKVWDATSGQELHTLKGHTNRVYSVAFSQDGMRLVSASLDGTVKVWDSASGQELHTLRAHGFSGVAFSPDGTRLASAGENGIVMIWDARPVTSAVRVEQEALGLVAFLFAKPLLKEDVVASIRANQTISDAVRQRALGFAARFRDDPSRLNEAAWTVIRWPGRTAEAYRLAFRAIEAACQREPGNTSNFITLGVAQYRVGKYLEAVKTLTQSYTVNALGPEGPQPAELAFLAMGYGQLGQKNKSEEYGERLRNTMRYSQWAQNDEAQSFLREAETLLQAQRTKPIK